MAVAMHISIFSGKLCFLYINISIFNNKKARYIAFAYQHIIYMSEITFRRAAMNVNRTRLKQTPEESPFQLRLDIVRHIVHVYPHS